MLSKSAGANPNYVATVVQLGEPMKHPNADRLQIFIIEGNRVITDMSRFKGEVGVFFPLESKLSTKLLSGLNMYEDANLNKEVTKKGYVNSKSRVRAVRLRSEPSMGLFLTIEEISSVLGAPGRYVVGEEFDTWNDELIVEKYVPRGGTEPNPNKVKSAQKKLQRFNRLIDNQFRLHEDTTNLRKNIHRISPEDTISVTYKMHGTSWVVGNVLTRKKLTFWQRILKWFGADVREEEYDIIYSSRSVVKNKFANSNPQHFYDTDLWGDIKDYLGDKIPEGFTLYGEAVGFTRNARSIQKDYDYGYKVPLPTEEYKEGIHYGVYVYRVTFTNINGHKYELSWGQVKQFCSYYGLKHVPEIYYGKAKTYDELSTGEHWHANVLATLEKAYLEQDCHMCSKTVPAEGIVVRKDSFFDFEAHKLKSFRFLEKETKDLDKGEVDMETEQHETTE